MKLQFEIPRINLEDVFACAQCGYCVVQCPVYSVIGWESYSPRGRLFLFKKLGLKNPATPRFDPKRIDLVKQFADRLYNCSLCGRCKTVCHLNLDLLELWENIRRVIAELGYAPEVVYQLENSILEHKNIYAMDNTMRGDWILYTGAEVPTKEKARVVYFTGCVTAFSGRVQGVAYAISAILNHVGEDWTVLPDEWCCGHPLLLGGAIKRYREVAERNVAEIERIGAEIVVTGCPGCYLALKKEYPKILGRKPKFKVYHATELIAEYIAQGKLEVPKNGFRLAYHDPCELGRIAGIIEVPRQIISAVGELLEPREAGIHTRCCGGGGLLKAVKPELSAKLAEVRVNQLLNLKPNAIVTACPSCELNLREPEASKKIRILDVAELIAETLGLI